MQGWTSLIIFLLKIKRTLKTPWTRNINDFKVAAQKNWQWKHGNKLTTKLTTTYEPQKQFCGKVTTMKPIFSRLWTKVYHKVLPQILTTELTTQVLVSCFKFCGKNLCLNFQSENWRARRQAVQVLFVNEFEPNRKTRFPEHNNDDDTVSSHSDSSLYWLIF